MSEHQVQVVSLLAHSLAALLKDPTISINGSEPKILDATERSKARDEHYENLIDSIDWLTSAAQLSNDFESLVCLAQDIGINISQDLLKDTHEEKK